MDWDGAAVWGHKREVLPLKQLSVREGGSLESSGGGSGKLLHDKVLYLELDKGRLQPAADSDAATEDERHPLLPAQIQRGSLSTFCGRENIKRYSYGRLTLLWALCAAACCADYM